MKVLLIEDSEEIVKAVSLSFELRWPGAIFLSTDQGDDGIELAKSESPDIVLLDINLPDMSGFDVLESIRLFSDVPVIILTVRGEQIDDELTGLETGADDYIVKPFAPANLLTRTRAVLRRSGIREAETAGLPPLVARDLTINFDNRQISRGSEQTTLTPTEYKVLFCLARNEGKTVPQNVIKQQVYGSESRYVDSATLKRFVYQLRNKLGDTADQPQLIFSERGVGYRFVRPK
ncbi:response regulator transcription factor [Chloroflexota bacterium]